VGEPLGKPRVRSLTDTNQPYVSIRQHPSASVSVGEVGQPLSNPRVRSLVRYEVGRGLVNEAEVRQAETEKQEPETHASTHTHTHSTHTHTHSRHTRG
jgi:hypothetical protein